MTSQTVKEQLFRLGADLCNIANVERFTDAPKGFHPTDVLPSCRSVIVMGNKFLAGTYQCLSTVPYTIVRNILSDKMDKMAVQFCLDMEAQGTLVIPTGTNGPTEFDERTLRSRNIVSAKHCAELAGMGRIGRNSLLITPEYGNMVWLSVLLTDAVLEPDPMLEEDLCRHCNRCVEACPIGALNGPLMNQPICWNYAFGSEGKGNWKIKCFACRQVCPMTFGSKNKRALP